MHSAEIIYLIIILSIVIFIIFDRCRAGKYNQKLKNDKRRYSYPEEKYDDILKQCNLSVSNGPKTLDCSSAELIVQKYGGAIASPCGGIARHESLLPCSKSKIREAYFAYIDAYARDFGNLPKDLGENLVCCYAMMDAFVADDMANYINNIGVQLKNKELDANNLEDKKKIDEYFKFSETSIYNPKYISYERFNFYIGEDP